MYCPEANVLIPRDVDPESKTPAFKRIVVSVTAESLESSLQAVPAQAKA
jgi:hypothetical protein